MAEHQGDFHIAEVGRRIHRWHALRALARSPGTPLTVGQCPTAAPGPMLMTDACMRVLQRVALARQPQRLAPHTAAATAAAAAQLRCSR